MHDPSPEMKAFLAKIANSLKKEDFAFTVEVLGTKYDVYHFRNAEGAPRSIAWTIMEGQAVIAAYTDKHATEDEMYAQLLSHEN
jgi:hypothetical protein